MRFFKLLFLVFPCFLFAQNLPYQYYFSEDNRQLLRGGFDIEEGLYSELNIDTVFLYFEQDDYWEQMHDNYCDKINIEATMHFKGSIFSQVGVRFKGQTSYANTNGGNGGGGPGGNAVDTDKKSFNIELDWINNQDIDGYETLNLNNCYQDPSFLREFLFEKLARNYIPAAQVNFVQLMINDDNWGLYPNVQQLDKKHSGEWFFDKNCTRWRAEDPNATSPGCGEGGGPGQGGPNFGAGTSSLNFLGMDTLNYQDHYTLKKSYVENPWDDLVNACKAVDDVNDIEESEIYEFLNEHLDLDATLWHLATEIIFSDDDSYIHKGGMDYYVYFDTFNERILPIEYDGNTVFGNPNWGPFYHQYDADYALLNKLLPIPEIRQRYLAHFRTILSSCFDSNFINNEIDEYANMIDSYVSDDPQKIYSYNEFNEEIVVLKDYFSERENYLWSNNEVSQEGAVILNVTYFVDGVEYVQPDNTDNVQIEVEVDSPEIITVKLYYGTGLTGRFQTIDLNYIVETGKYTCVIPPQESGEYVRFYVETITDNGVRFYSPEGAEHNIFIYQVSGHTDLTTLVETDKKLLKTIDLLGREVVNTVKNTPLFDVYNDGSVQKRVIIE